MFAESGWGEGVDNPTDTQIKSQQPDSTTVHAAFYGNALFFHQHPDLAPSPTLSIQL